MQLYGLIGNPLTHSFSKKYFTEKFSREGVTDSRYELFPIPSIGELPALVSNNPSLAGFNVTIPYKQEVLAFVDEQDEVVRAIGAANCIRIVNGRLVAYNTDVIGFEQSLLDKWGNHHRRALVLGTGGASKAVIWVLNKLGIDVQLVSRNPSDGSISYDSITPALLGGHTLVVNSTPLGTWPDVDAAPALPYDAVTPDHYFFDLVYNPPLTTFLRLAQANGAVVRNGYDMLEIQAEASWRIWNSVP
ncbi:MAG: shikimate dehydrogenase [Chitinophagaceae bacterium]|nr:MAG: shikimate dehydrogenase [Chitinophagaceae bacterium]